MPHDDLLLQIGAPEALAFRAGSDGRPCLRTLPGTSWRLILLIMRDRQVDLRAEGGTLLASGRLAHVPGETLDRLEAIRDAILASRSRDALAHAAAAWALADCLAAEARGGPWSRSDRRLADPRDGRTLVRGAGLGGGLLDGIFLLLRGEWRGLEEGGLCGVAEPGSAGAHGRLARRDAYAVRLADGYGRWAADLFVAKADRIA